MTTIHPARLARLVSKHEVFDLVDVRPKEEFNRLHIPGARSNPLNEMTPVKILRERKLPASAPLFVISQDSRAGHHGSWNPPWSGLHSAGSSGGRNRGLESARSADYAHARIPLVKEITHRK
jgi:hypothetical protein